MKRPVTREPAQIWAAPRNFLAAIVFLGAAVTLVLNFEPRPAGATSAGLHHQANYIAPIPAPVMPTAATTGSPGATAPGAPLSGRFAILLQLALLEDGQRKLAGVADYSAMFVKQERIDGELPEPQSIVLKMRHEPFSVYMKWLSGDVGREILYVDGLNENRMLVKKGGRMGRLLPVLKLEPTGSLAMRESRHPVTDAGLLNLTKKVASYRQRDLTLPADHVTCKMLGESTLEGRNCYVFENVYRDATVDPVYRRSVIYIDCEHSLPIHVKNYTWPVAEEAIEVAAEETEAAATEEGTEEAAGDEDHEDPAVVSDDPEIDTLIECYTWSELQLIERLTANAFDHENREYTFKR